MSDVTFLSLYDYLGHAAGQQLGKQVADAAARAKISFQTKKISNPRYTGTIMMYPKYFLDEYFKVEQTDDLPF